jgi:hypothetical protein
VDGAKAFDDLISKYRHREPDAGKYIPYHLSNKMGVKFSVSV